MSRLTLRNLHPSFGAEVLGADLKREATPAVAAELRTALHVYGVVALRGQNLTDDELETLGHLLGAVFQPSTILAREGRQALAFRLTNIAQDGQLMAANDRARAVNDANQLWHTDSTYLRPRAEFSLLSAATIPPSGGETEFCDMRVAYERLPADRRRDLEGLFGHHSVIHSRKLTGFNQWSEQELTMLKPIRRPMVHLHTDSGRKALCLASHICAIDGMTEAEAQHLVDDLIAEVTAPDRRYAHVWTAGDLLIWDNRVTMHRARPFEDMVYPRDMRSLRTVDTADAEV